MKAGAFIVMTFFFFGGGGGGGGGRRGWWWGGWGEGAVYISGLSNRIMRKIFSHWRLEPV